MAGQRFNIGIAKGIGYRVKYMGGVIAPLFLWGRGVVLGGQNRGDAPHETGGWGWVSLKG